MIERRFFIKWEKLKKLLPFVDLFLYDLKNMDSKGHQRLTGVPNDLILDNLIRLSQYGKNIDIRIPT